MTEVVDTAQYHFSKEDRWTWKFLCKQSRITNSLSRERFLI